MNLADLLKKKPNAPQPMQPVMGKEKPIMTLGGSQEVPQDVPQEGAIPMPTEQPSDQIVTPQPTQPQVQQAPQDASAPQGTNTSRLEALMKQYEEIGSQPAKKQNPWAQAAFLALQGLGNYADRASGRNPQEIQLLGNAKKKYQMEQMQERLRPLMESEKFRVGQEKIQRDAQKDELDMDRVKSLIETTKNDDIRGDAALEHKKQKDEVESQIRRDRLDFDKEKSDELAQLRRDKLEYQIENDAKRAEQTQQRIDELIRSNKVKEGQGERKLAIQESKAQQAIKNAQSGGTKAKAPKGAKMMTIEQAHRFARQLDKDFNDGKISKEAYDKHVDALPTRIQR